MLLNELFEDNAKAPAKRDRAMRNQSNRERGEVEKDAMPSNKRRLQRVNRSVKSNRGYKFGTGRDYDDIATRAKG